MLIVAGSIVTEPGGREPFLNAVQPMVAATLEESGCHEYAFTPDPNDDNRVLLYELWDDQTALDGTSPVHTWLTGKRPGNASP